MNNTRRKAFVILVASLIIAILSGCSKEPPNVLFITLDALRADHMSIYGYHRKTSPNLDKFFTQGTVYEYAYCTEANTGPSVVSFLSGMLPQETGVRLLMQKCPEDLTLMPDYLSEVGYQTAGIVSNMVLTTEASALDVHFDYFDDYLDDKEPYRKVFERNARATTDAGLLWLVEAYDSKKPYFLWLHYQDTHGPYHPPPDKPVEFTHPRPKMIDIARIPEYTVELIPDKKKLKRLHPSSKKRFVSDGLAYVDRYDEELAYADFHINRLLEAFEEKGLLKNTLVIFSADHGESMMEHEKWFTHGYHIYEEITHVPLLVRYPDNKETVRVKTRVSLVDLLPTILDLVGIEAPAGLRGKPLTKAFGTEPVYAQGMEWRSMIYDHKKWLIIYGEDQDIPLRRYMYNLLNDPVELDRLPWVNSPEAEAFYQLIASDPDPGGIPEEFAKGMHLSAPKGRPGLDEKTLKRLKSLGYVE
jgi:arylsulfatase